MWPWEMKVIQDYNADRIYFQIIGAPTTALTKNQTYKATILVKNMDLKPPNADVMEV